MATVVNARDVILQAALPNGRVAGVTMQSNIVVDPSQVTGLGLIILGTKTVDLESSSQVYQVATSGTATPSTITLTLNLRNIVGTPSLSILSGSYTGGLPTLSGGPIVYTASIAYANMTTDTLSIRATVTESSINYTDDITLVKVREGSQGITAFLTNEAHTVPASATGTVSSYSGAGGTFKVYQGAVDVSASATYALQSNPQSLTTSINATTGVFSVTAGFADGTDAATVTYRATYGGATFDKVFSLSKSKTGVAGTAGTNGTNGTNGSNGAAGQRGSRTFYVSGITSWSDATATSTASVSGGPVVNDVVTQYDSTAGFSQTRFWTGTVWTIVAAVVDGSLLVSGTVGAAAVAANAIRASHLLVTGGSGQALNGDPTCSDPASWFRPAGLGNALVFTTVTDGKASNRVIRSTGAHYFSSQVFPVQGGKKYRVSGYYRRTATGTGTSLLYLRVLAYNAAGGQAGEYRLADPSTGAFNYEGVSVATSTTWVKFSGQWTADAAAIWGYLDIHGLWDTNTGGTMEYQDLRVDEMVDASLVVVGGITADRIDTRNLTIKDGAGNIVFSSGTAVPASAASAGGWNPQFSDWTGTYPTNWVGWSNGASIVKETSIVRTGPYAVRFPTGGIDTGITRQVMWASTPTVANTFIQGSVDIYIVTDSGGGLPGLLVRPISDAGATTFVDTTVVPPSRATGAWQRVPFTARLTAGQQMFGLHIYIMGGWSGLPGGNFNGTVIFDNLTFEFCDATTDNTRVSISSGGVLSGAGGGTVTIGGLDSTVIRSANPITSGNVSTYIANASIGTAQISTLNASVITAGTITTDRLVVGAATAASGAVVVGLPFTVIASSATSTTQSFPTLITFTSTGAPLTISFALNLNIQLGNAALNAAGFIAYMMIDGSTTIGLNPIGIEAGAISALYTAYGVSGNPRVAAVCLPYVHRVTLSAGSHTFGVRVYANWLNSTAAPTAGAVAPFAYSIIAGDISMVVQENKV